MASLDKTIDLLMDRYPVSDILRTIAGTLEHEATRVQNEGFRTAHEAKTISAYRYHVEDLRRAAKDIRACAREVNM